MSVHVEDGKGMEWARLQWLRLIQHAAPIDLPTRLHRKLSIYQQRALVNMLGGPAEPYGPRGWIVREDGFEWIIHGNTMVSLEAQKLVAVSNDGKCRFTHIGRWIAFICAGLEADRLTDEIKAKRQAKLATLKAF